jgi:hypothetical protein
MTSDRDLIKRYFLGSASVDERSRLEDSYLADNNGFEEMVAAENDLIDAYARGELTNPEKAQFEKEYMNTPDRRARLEFARALRVVGSEASQAVVAEKVSLWQRIRSHFQPTGPQFRWALVASAVFLVVGGAWLVRQNQGLRGELQQSRGAQAELHKQLETKDPQLAEQAKEPLAGTEVAKLEMPPLPELNLTLNPGVSRGSERRQEVLSLLPTPSRIQLQLTLDDANYLFYEAVLETAEGREVHRVGSLKAHGSAGGKSVVLRLPSRLIPPGDYVVRVNGTNGGSDGAEEVDVYTFRAVLK